MADGDETARRRVGRPRLDPTSASTTFSVRLPNRVIDSLIARAARDGVSVGEAARRLLVVTLTLKDRGSSI